MSLKSVKSFKCRHSAVALTMLLTGCAGQTTFDYHRDGENNLTAYADKSSKRWLSSRHLNIALHHEKESQPCHWEYAGTILLDDNKQQASGQQQIVDRPPRHPVRDRHGL